MTNLQRHGILKTDMSKTTGILAPVVPAELCTNNWLATSGSINAKNSDNNRNIMNRTHPIEIVAPVFVGCVKSLGILR